MNELRHDIHHAITEKLLRQYFNDVQEIIALLMFDEIDADELEERLFDLDYVYANKILREVEK